MGKPTPISDTAVRTHASRVRSAPMRVRIQENRVSTLGGGGAGSREGVGTSSCVPSMLRFIALPPPLLQEPSTGERALLDIGRIGLSGGTVIGRGRVTNSL